MASGKASILDWRSPILSRVRASFGSSATSFWYSRTALSYFFFSTNFWAAWSTLSRSIATGRGTPISARWCFDAGIDAYSKREARHEEAVPSHTARLRHRRPPPGRCVQESHGQRETPPRGARYLLKIALLPTS